MYPELLQQLVKLGKKRAKSYVTGDLPIPLDLLENAPATRVSRLVYFDRFRLEAELDAVGLSVDPYRIKPRLPDGVPGLTPERLRRVARAMGLPDDLDLDEFAKELVKAFFALGYVTVTDADVGDDGEPISTGRAELAKLLAAETLGTPGGCEHALELARRRVAEYADQFEQLVARFNAADTGLRYSATWGRTAEADKALAVCYRDWCTKLGAFFQIEVPTLHFPSARAGYDDSMFEE